MNNNIVFGVFGATSPTGNSILNILAQAGYEVVAFSRTAHSGVDPRCHWVNLSNAASVESAQAIIQTITHVISVAHIWTFPEVLEHVLNSSIQKAVCISSTSVFTKTNSSSASDLALVERLKNGERAAAALCEHRGIDLTIVRPTIIYGKGNDRNISEIMKLIKKFHFFPLLGQASGKRQPIHVDDVAQACVKAALSASTYNKSYNIAGSEVLSYKEMVTKVFAALQKKPIFFHVPLFSIKILISILNKIPKYKNWNIDMANRMNQDLVFDISEAQKDFAFTPKGFVLEKEDVI